MALKPPVEVPQGAIRLNTDSQKMEFFAQDQWWEMATDVPTLNSGSRACFMGGFQDQPVNNTTFDTIDYITISSAGDAIDFGDLNAKLFDGVSNVSSSTRQFALGGRVGPSFTYSNEIKFITYSSTGDSTDFGDLTNSVAGYRPAGFSNSTRGIRAGGSNNPGVGGTNVMDYITMASEGNAVDFGDLATAKLKYGGAVSSSTRGVICWGNSHPSTVNTMEFVTIATTGNATDFGDLVNPGNSGASGNSTRGIICSNSPFVIQSIQLATKGNATSFGTLSATRSDPNAASSPTRIVMVGGVNYPAYLTTMDYLSIQEGGQAVDFGDLTVNRHTDNAGSNAHGGL